MLRLNTLKSKETKKSKKRVGRGNASGTGTYAARGLKGQRSRSGGKGGLKLKGLKQTFKSIPKKKGFTSPHNKLEVVNVAILDKKYKTNETVKLPGYKILGQGEITKALNICAESFSKSAQTKIEKAGGKIIKCGKKS